MLNYRRGYGRFLHIGQVILTIAAAFEGFTVKINPPDFCRDELNFGAYELFSY